MTGIDTGTEGGMGGNRRWLARVSRGFSYLALGPSSRLRRLREEAETHAVGRPFGSLPPLPDSAYPPGAVPLDCSGIPAEARLALEAGMKARGRFW